MHLEAYRLPILDGRDRREGRFFVIYSSDVFAGILIGSFFMNSLECILLRCFCFLNPCNLLILGLLQPYN